MMSSTPSIRKERSTRSSSWRFRRSNLFYFDDSNDSDDGYHDGDDDADDDDGK